MHSFYSKFTSGDTVCLAVDAIAELELEEREFGMITEVIFTGSGVSYRVMWSDRTHGKHIEQELTLVVSSGKESEKPSDD